MTKQKEKADSPGIEVDAEDMEYWHKLCCLGELGWMWDSVHHFAPWKNKNGERDKFENIDDAIKAHRQRFTQ